MENFRRNLSQPGKYAVEILKRFDTLECKAMDTPMDSNLKLLVDDSSKLVDVTQYRQIIGSLMYLKNTRPEICFVVNTLSQYLVQPRRVHLIAAKHVMKYLKGTIDFGLYYDGNHDYRLYGLYKCRLGWKRLRQKKHIRWMLLSGVCYEFMV